MVPKNVPNDPIYKHDNIYTTNLDPFPIKGLKCIPNFITDKEHDELLDMINHNPWSLEIHRRQQFYGKIYYHTTHDLVKIQPSATANPATDPQHKGPQSLELDAFKGIIDKLIEMGLLPSDDPPTQVLVNEYVGCCGIANHFDDSLAFGDAIVTISLEKPVWLLLSNSEESTKVLLEKNSLFVMKEDARYKCKHGISKQVLLDLILSMGPLARRQL